MGPLKLIQGNIQVVYIIDAPPPRQENNISDELGLPIPQLILFQYRPSTKGRGGVIGSGCLRFWEVGGGCLDVGTVLCFFGKGCPSISFIDVGYIPVHWEETRSILPYGGLQIDGESAKQKDGLDLVLPPNGGGDGGDGHTVGEYLRLLPTEHGHTIHCNQSHYGTMYSGRGMPWEKYVKVVVVEVVLGHGRNIDTSLGGRTGRQVVRVLWRKDI